MNEHERQRNIARERARIMIAWADGKTVQCMGKNNDVVWDDVAEPCWNWDVVNYRIKPEPRVIYVHNNDIPRFLRGDKVSAHDKGLANFSGIHNFTKFQEVP